MVVSLPLFFPMVGQANSSPQIIILGDSLSSGHEIDIKLGWVNLIRESLNTCESGYEVVNLSTSGDTTRNGLTKINQALASNPEVLILELGGNDGLRGLPPFTIKRNLKKIIEQSLETKTQVLLVGIHIPPNYGQSYTEQFYQIYTDLAEEYSLPFVEFMLDGVALNKEMMQRDGIHPNAKGQPIIAQNIWAILKPLLSPKKVSNCSL